MVEKCVICSSVVEENFGKLKGTMIKVKDEKSKLQLIYVCSDCQKKDDWINTAKIKGV
jgi:hypothetical protein